MKPVVLIVAGALAGTFVNSHLSAQEEQRVQQESQKQETQMLQTQGGEQVRGSQLMTEQERIEHQKKLRSMKTEQEREAYRAQHHEEMKRRAREQGVEMPDQVPPKGQGSGYKGGSSMGGARDGGSSGGGKGK